MNISENTFLRWLAPWHTTKIWGPCGNAWLQSHHSGGRGRRTLYYMHRRDCLRTVQQSKKQVGTHHFHNQRAWKSGNKEILIISIMYGNYNCVLFFITLKQHPREITLYKTCWDIFWRCYNLKYDLHFKLCSNLILALICNTWHP